MNFNRFLDFHQNLWEEVDKAKLRSDIASYYKNIKRNKQRRWFYAFNWASRIENLAKEIKPGCKILDAGCGVGTEAIFAA